MQMTQVDEMSLLAYVFFLFLFTLYSTTNHQPCIAHCTGLKN